MPAKRKTPMLRGAMALRDPRVRAANSPLISRAMFASRAGITFRGQRDLYTALGYQRILRPEDYRSRFMRGGIGARVVEALPKATWRGGVEILEDDDPKNVTEFEEAFANFAKRLRLWSQVVKADILAGLGQYSVLLIGAPGQLQDPLPDRFDADDVLYLSPYSQEDVLINTVEVKTDSERFGLPTMYTIRRLAGAQYLGGAVVGSRLVHWTRVIHLADESLDDRVYGHPRLERVWNLLDDLEKVVGAGSEAFWKRADQGIVFDMDPELEWDDTEVAAVNAAADDFTHGYRRMLTTRGMKMAQLGSDVANYDKQVDAIITLIAGATGIPKRILVGSERGELASTQDRENWEDRVNDRRFDYGENVVLRPLIKRLVDHGALPEPEEVIIRWPEIEYLNDVEKAQIAESLAKVNAEIGGVVVTPQEIRDRILRWEKLEEKQLPGPDGWAPNVPYLSGGDGDFSSMPWDKKEVEEPAVPEQDDEEGQEPPAPRTSSAAHPADELRGTLRFQMLRTLRRARKEHSAARVHDAVTGGSGVDGVRAAMSGVGDRISAGVRTLASVVGEAHHLSRVAARKAINPRVKLAARRDDVAERSQQYAIDKITSEVTALDRESRERVGATAQRAFDEGWSTDKLSRRLESTIGLNDKQATAVDNLRIRLESANPGDVVQFGDRSARVPRDGGSEAWIEKQVDRYSESLLEQRADTIADGLLTAAKNEGRREAWVDAKKDGDLPANAERVWVATGKSCPECVDMSGQTAKIGAAYVGPEGEPVDGPQLHPWCDCYEEIFVPDKPRKKAASVLKVIASAVHKFMEGAR